MAKRRFFFDTEFIEDGETIDLISIGVVDQTGKRSFYAVSTEADLTLASPWMREHVLPQLPQYGDQAWMPRKRIGLLLDQFLFDGLSTRDSIELWAYYADYDWVAVCQLFGTMLELPSGWPKYAMDLKMLAVLLGNPTLPKQDESYHNALSDARGNLKSFRFLQELAKKRSIKL